MKVYIIPHFEGADTGEGGIRRVVEAQRKWLPTVGVGVVDNIEDCDIVGAHATAWPKTNKPVVSHNHGLYWAEYEWPEWCRKANEHVIEAMRRADAVTVVSQWVRDAVSRGTWINPKVVYHGIDLDEWKMLPRTEGSSSTPADGYVLWNKTRPDTVCDPTPMQDLARMCPDVKFITTFGSDKSTPNVTIIGRTSYADARGWVAGASVYLCTTRETFGIGTLEALAAGVPVIGWEWGGQREIITNNVDGILVQPGDFAALEKALRTCLEPATWARMSASARKKAEQFQWKDMIVGYRDVYEEVLDRRRTSLKVSVVVRCYNLGNMVGDAVRSAVDQASEVIIIDDASTDESPRICDELATQYDNVRVVHNEHNQYLAGALNAGVSCAKGRFIVPLDADDMLGDGAVAILADALDADSGLDIAYGSMSVIEDGKKEWTSSWPATFDFGAQMAHKNQISYCAMYRKKVWERVGGYRRRCKTGEDPDFWCRTTSYGAKAKKVTDAVVLRYRVRADSVSHTVPDWPWEKWYPWYRDARIAPPISPMGGSIWTYEPPRISVVIPCGPGHTKMVLDAVDSLVAQDFRQWEAIVVNDSDVDFDWLHPFVRVVSTGGGHGPAVARNLGFAAARGVVVLPLDADDYLQPNALSSLWEVWQERGGYVYSDWVVQETGELKQAEDYDCGAILRHLPHAVTALYAKKDWQAIGGFDEKLDAWEDWDFVIALAANGVCGHRVAEPLLQYRMNGGKRREELYARREELKGNIARKWRKYFDGSEKLMACGGCGGGKPQASPKDFNMLPAARMNSNGGGHDDLVLLEYVGRTPGPLTFRGQQTGVMYRFGLDVHHKIKYVHRADADAMLGRQDFRAAKATVDLLQAAAV